MFLMTTSVSLRQKTLSALLIVGLTLFSSNYVTANEMSQKPLSEILKSNYVGEVPAESSQYDFFVGEWNVSVKVHNKAGKVVDSGNGVWWAKYLHGKRILFDDVVFFDVDNKISTGYPSLRTFSTKLGKWQSMHMAPLMTQAVCSNVGTWENNEMHIQSTCRKQDGTLQGYSKVRFYNITEDSWDYTWHESKDNRNFWLYINFEGERRK